MARIEQRLREMGLVLPAALKAPSGRPPFAPARVVGARVFVSGHPPLNPDGTLAPPFAKVGREVSAEQACRAARLAASSILGSLQRALGDLDRVSAWTRVFGVANAAQGFNKTPDVINGFSDLALELFGPEVGAHARSAVGVAEPPFDIPVEIEAEAALIA